MSELVNTNLDDAVKPMGYRVVVREDPIEVKSEGGIILHASKDEKDRQQAGQVWGTLVAVGETAFTGADWQRKDEEGKFIPNENAPEVGDKVFYSRYSGQPYGKVGHTEADSTYHLVADSAVLGVVTNPEQLQMID